MAHEIKNPLGAISIHIQLIQKALLKARENDDKLPAPKFVEDHIDVVNEEIAGLCSKYNIEVQSWLKLATEVMNTQEMQVA